MEIYLKIVTHPLLWVFIGLTLAFYLIQWAVSLKVDTSQKPLLGLNQKHVAFFAFLFTATILSPLIGLSSQRLIEALQGQMDFRSTEERSAAIRNIGLFLAATVGLPFLVWRSIVAQKQVDVAEQGQITDRINKAVEGLGSEKSIKRLYLKKQNGDPDYSKPVMEEVTAPNLEVRIGAVYALERIAQDSERDHLQVMEILCAYIRQNCQIAEPIFTDDLQQRPVVRSDIQTAITVIGRRNKNRKKIERENRYRLDFNRCDLSGVNFKQGDFDSAEFNLCRIEAALFDGCSLIGAQFLGSVLNHTSWLNANLMGARLDKVVINRPIPQPGGMVDSINMAKNLIAVNFSGADLSAIDYLGGPEITNETFGTLDTELHDEVLESLNDLSQLRALNRELRLAEKSGSEDRIKLAEQKLIETGFRFWAPYNRSDMAVPFLYKRLLDRHRLSGFPFAAQK